MKPLVHSERTSARRQLSAGFTLIELLVALTILAVVALLAWRGLDQVARGRATLSRAMESERALSQLYDQMHSDVQQTVRDYDISTPPIRSGQGSLQIVRALRMPGQTTRLQVVRYQLQDGHVVRYASPSLATSGQLRAVLGLDASMADWSAVDLVEGVTDFNTRLYVPRSGWVDDWESAQTAFNDNLNTMAQSVAAGGPMPRSIIGVEFKMHVLGQRGPFTRVFLAGE
jgi:general secretion pathway protein J